MAKRLTGSTFLEGMLIDGDLNDLYFTNIEGIVAALAPLEGWIKQHLPSDAVVIDAGGNIGIVSLLLSRAVPNGQVHIFEAMPKNFEYLCKNIRQNSISNCTANLCALGSKPGFAHVIGEGSACHVDPITIPGTTGVIEVEMIAIDHYLQDKNLTRLDFVKLDVEGFEPAVLEGASQSIAKFKPTIFMEFNTWCLSFVQSFDARRFAECLFETFDVTSLDQSGIEHETSNGDVYRFLHDNVVLHGTVEDIMLRLKPTGTIRNFNQSITLPDSSLTDKARLTELKAEVVSLKEQLTAIHSSTSWRMTAPVRMLRRLLSRTVAAPHGLP